MAIFNSYVTNYQRVILILSLLLSRSCEWTESPKYLRYMCISPRKYILTPHMKGPTSYI